MVKNLIVALTKIALAPVLYRHCAIGLRPRRLHLWLECLIRTSSVPGFVLEVGVASGGTAAFSHKFLREGGDQRSYSCIDTFSGFIREQFRKDVELGNTWSMFTAFSSSPKRLVRKVLDMHGATDVSLIESDISSLNCDAIVGPVSACLLDVDLAVPVYDGLKLIWPLLSPGGVIAVDDCLEDYNWRAIEGVKRFCGESGTNAEYSHGMALLWKN